MEIVSLELTASLLTQIQHEFHECVKIQHNFQQPNLKVGLLYVTYTSISYNSLLKLNFAELNENTKRAFEG